MDKWHHIKFKKKDEDKTVLSVLDKEGLLVVTRDNKTGKITKEKHKKVKL